MKLHTKGADMEFTTITTNSIFWGGTMLTAEGRYNAEVSIDGLNFDSIGHFDTIEEAIAEVTAYLFELERAEIGAEEAPASPASYDLPKNVIEPLLDMDNISSVVLFYDGENDDIYTLQVETPEGLFLADILVEEAICLMEKDLEALDFVNTLNDVYEDIWERAEEAELTEEERFRQEYEAYLEERWEESRAFRLCGL